MSMIKLTINGEEKAIEADSTVISMLEQLSIDPKRVVVEHNRKILKRAELSETKVAASDSIEIVHFVGGG